jgi:hypothetical protein
MIFSCFIAIICHDDDGRPVAVHNWTMNNCRWGAYSTKPLTTKSKSILLFSLSYMCNNTQHKRGTQSADPDLLVSFFLPLFSYSTRLSKTETKENIFFFFLNKKYVGRDEKEKEYSNALLRIHDECAVWGPTERAQPRPMKWPIKLSHIYYNIHTFLLNVGTGTHSTLGAAYKPNLT